MNNNSQQGERRMRAKELFDKHCPFKDNTIAWSAWKMAFDLAQETGEESKLRAGMGDVPVQNENWQQKLIGRVKERFNELAEKEFQWRSFYHGWLEGRFDMKRSDTPPPQPLGNSTDCRTETGITVGLIDSLISISRVLVKRDLSTLEVKEALKDIQQDEDLKIICSPCRKPLGIDVDKMAKDYAGKIKDTGMLLKRVIIADAFKAGYAASPQSSTGVEELRQLFDNNFDCHTSYKKFDDSKVDVPAMTKKKFIEILAGSHKAITSEEEGAIWLYILDGAADVVNGRISKRDFIEEL